MKVRESVEKLDKKLNIVIMGFSELGQGFYDILKATNNNVYVVSVSGKNEKLYKEHGVTPYNRYEGFPVKYEDIDCVLLCCRTNQLSNIKELIPDEVLPKIIDKCIAFQNGFNVKEELMSLFGKSIPRSVPYFSCKNYDGKKITLKIVKPSPIKGIKDNPLEKVINIANSYSQDHFKQNLFEDVTSIVVQREGDLKATMNSMINSLCVIYKGDVESSIRQFSREFGEDALEKRSKEINEIVNSSASPILHTNVGEIMYRANQMIQKFAHEKPSSYQQYYTNAQKRGRVLADDEHLLGILVLKANEKHISAPISNEIRKRMKNIESEINKKIA